MALCQVIGLPIDASVETADSLIPAAILVNPAEKTRNALTGRAELAMLHYNVDLSRAGENIMKSRFLPDIGLTAGYGWLNPNPYNGFTKDFEGDLNVGIVCKVPLWHWGERIHTFKAAQHARKVSELKLSEAEEMISLQVKQACFHVLEAEKKTVLTHRSLSQAQENLRVTGDRFAEGILKATDVLEAQTLWQKAWSENIDAKCDWQLSQTYLKKVSGELQKENK
jgi:outer membrane protein TolC